MSRKYPQPPQTSYRKFMRTVGRVRRGMYQGSRIVRDLEVLASGDWRKILRRVKNKILGRVIARGAWKIWQ